MADAGLTMRENLAHLGLTLAARLEECGMPETCRTAICGWVDAAALKFEMKQTEGSRPKPARVFVTAFLPAPEGWQVDDVVWVKADFNTGGPDPMGRFYRRGARDWLLMEPNVTIEKLIQGQDL